MLYIILYLEGCPFSENAEELLKEKDLKYTKLTFTTGLDASNSQSLEIPLLDNKSYFINNDKLDKRIFKDFFGEDATFPRIYEGDKLIGGYSELKEKFN